MKIFTHRGDRTSAVENTIQACEAAIAQGAGGIEIDIRETGTGEIVLFHDFSLKRMFNRPGYIGRSSFQELRAIPYVSHNQKNTQFIDTLDAILDRFKNSLPINLDAKTIHFFDFKFADKIISTIRNHDLYDTVWISCFNPFLLQILKLKDKRIRTGYLFQRVPLIHTLYDRITWADAWHPHFRIVTDDLVRRARRYGKQIYVWTVNDELEFKRLREYEVDGIISDEVGRMHRLAAS